ncbi:transcriptional regulator [Paenibacillus dokdonensis]|uniref:Transcriptional regulator n=1 Tax=Paenibacillus dokdonensis TaxID=2567944 RepID=A0ABU6GPJ6_9BACL|nr:transcriptional regulator [Paenibacillus dokdonensis]MEC0241669.1 transcriptional regulator [Paenibacillus dokdonensis]
MHSSHSDSLPIWAIVLVIAILLTQSLWLFTHARRHTKVYWFWGIIGLIQCPSPLIAYWFVYVYWPRRKERQKNRES